MSLEKRRSSIPDLTLEEIFDYEKIRYQRKGYGTLFSIIITLSFFLVLPDILKSIYPKHLENEGKFEYFLGLLVHTGGFIFFNLIMYVIYHIEHPFFERYKINDRPWPWNNKGDDWNSMLRSTLKILAFNHFIVLPIIASQSLISGK